MKKGSTNGINYKVNSRGSSVRYMGSKGRYAKHIVPIIMAKHDQTKPYVEPFVGGGNLFSEVPAKIKWGNDTAKYAVALLEGLSNGWTPPDTLSELDYHQIKEDPHGYDPELVGFAAYCCSYSGKLWGGYWRSKDSKGNPRNPAKEQASNLGKQRKGLVGAKFTNMSYLNMGITGGSTVYCDPPYANTTGYKGGFDHTLFWGWCEDLVAKGCNVFVSEYTAPDGWDYVWSKCVTNSLTKDTGSKVGTEKLFTKVIAHDT
jgi:DNA adenine methylase